MKSETRANWIFLGLFMLVMAPGLAILTIKAYRKGNAAGMNPPAPHTAAAYNDTNPQNPALPRLVPPITKGFVESIAQRVQGLEPELRRVTADDGSPVMSDQRSLELISTGADAKSRFVALIGWHRRFAPLPSLYSFTAVREDGESAPTLSAYEQLNLPIEARKELQQYGYTIPPDSVLWMILKLEGSNPVREIRMRYTFDGKVLEDRIIVPGPATSQRSAP